MAGRSFFTNVTFCVVTGASQGFGRDLSIAIAEKVGADSSIMIIGQNMRGLEETAKLIALAKPGIDVVSCNFDLRQTSLLTKNWFSEILIKLGKGHLLSVNYESCMLFHNAGSLGDVSGYVTDGLDVDHFKEVISLNTISPILLTAAFCKTFSINTLKAIVNISSLAALQPFPSWGPYCISRSAKEMAMKVLAEEEKDLRVLNYAPGPMVTSMTKTAAEQTKDFGIREFFKKMVEDGVGSVSIGMTITRLLSILEKNDFVSGVHIDFFDNVD